MTDISLIDVNGRFIKDESILINGVQNGRVITKVDQFGFDDVKSMIKEVVNEEFKENYAGEEE